MLYMKRDHEVLATWERVLLETCNSYVISVGKRRHCQNSMCHMTPMTKTCIIIQAVIMYEKPFSAFNEISIRFT